MSYMIEWGGKSWSLDIVPEGIILNDNRDTVISIPKENIGFFTNLQRKTEGTLFAPKEEKATFGKKLKRGGQRATLYLLLGSLFLYPILVGFGDFLTVLFVAGGLGFFYYLMVINKGKLSLMVLVDGECKSLDFVLKDPEAMPALSKELEKMSNKTLCASAKLKEYRGGISSLFERKK